MKPTQKPTKKLTVKLMTLKALSAEELRKVQGGGMVSPCQTSVRGCANTER